jgi:4Fe-4S ferredoxin
LVDGRVQTKPRIDIDPAKCSFCGECVALCPTRALSETVNDESEIPVIKGQAFPVLVRRVIVKPEICAATTETAYIEECPVGAISAEIERDADGRVLSVAKVDVDRKTCINCTHCMEEGPESAFTIVKPYKGRTYLDISLCPEGCQACADVCPTHCITWDGVHVALDERFCLFCGACENVCPAPASEYTTGAVRIVRTGFVHLPVESAAWIAALDKLVSFRAAARELDIKGQAKRRKAVADRLLPELADK